MTTTSAGATTQAPPHAVSAAQQAMWLHQQLHPDASLYNVYCSVRIDGPLDAGRLERAFAAVVARHESLRTTFPSRGGVPQPRVAPAAAEHDWFRLVAAAELVDVADLPDNLVDEQLARIVQDWCDQPFDLAAGPLLRVTVLRLAADRHLLVLCIHHIVCDGESLTRLFDEVSAVYSAGSEPGSDPGSKSAASLPELTAQYSDYVTWRRQQADPDTDLAWWRDYLAGVPDVLDLPADRPRPAVRTADGATIGLDLPADLVRGVAELARQRRMSQFMVLLAGFSALVARTSGAHDFVLSVPLTDRPLPEFEPLIGMFVNSLPVRVTVAPQAGFAELLKTVRRSVLEVLTHPGVSIDQLVAAVQPDRSPGHTPLVQVAFSAALALFADPKLGEL
ncbi:MAG: non-ribosomal peptide synthetase, partial [Actinobacteria bacterium]|nr:non-ribosomal peptide synthetase [Actinomycetota bacterium]